MKRALMMITISAVIFAGCNGTTTTTTNSQSSATTKTHKFSLSAVAPTPQYQFIPVDSANKMISSYLNSINYHQNDTDLRSLIFNADSLIAYLTSAKMTNVKFMFAHTLEYINNGGGNQNAGYQSGALTIVVAGYDSSGNYVYYNYPGSQTNMIIDRGMPCPSNCPVNGSASSDLLQ